jgi:hypothetical protein
MALVDDVLLEFGNQLSVSDIYNMTFKELGYLREHRRMMRETKPGVAEKEALSNIVGM